MTSILLRNISFHARRIHHLSHTFKSSPSIVSLYKPTSLFSASSDPSPPIIPHIHEKKQESLDVEDISNEELKRRVAKLREGDEEAIPAVFEAVLQRYLAGKPIDADQDLMRDILGKGTESKDDNEEDEDEFDSDLEGTSDSDLEGTSGSDLDGISDSDLEGTSDSDFEEE